MNFTEKLDTLLKEKKISKKQLAELSNIPYGTVLSFYIKGTENIKLSNLKKLSKALEVSLDYLTDDEILNRHNNQTVNISNLTDEDIEQLNLLADHLRKKNEK